MIYTQNLQSASYNEDYFIIMDDIVANEKDAHKIFQSQVAMDPQIAKFFETITPTIHLEQIIKVV